MDYRVSSPLYLEAAARLIEAIGASSYFSGSIEFGFDGIECRLTASVIVYRELERFPEGDRERIVDLVPVWWEFHTSDCAGELLNDFSFAELRACL